MFNRLRKGMILLVSFAQGMSLLVTPGNFRFNKNKQAKVKLVAAYLSNQVVS